MSTEKLNLDNFWQHFLGNVRFYTLLYYKPMGQCNCWTEQLLGSRNSSELVPQLLWINQIETFYWRRKWHKNVLSIVCMPAEHYRSIIRSLGVILDYIRVMPVLLEVCSEEGLENMEQISKLCLEYHMPNVLLIDANFTTNLRIYSYQVFPAFKLISQLYQSNLKLYPHKLTNMHGYAITTLPDQSEPMTIVHRNKNGTLQIGGAVWHTLSSFASHYNATLRLMFEPTIGMVINYTRILAYIRNNSMDIAASVKPFMGEHGAKQGELSYPLFVSSWCSMVPIWHVLATHEVMLHVVESPLAWLWIFLSYAISRWLPKLLRYLGLVRFGLCNLVPLVLQMSLICAVYAHMAALFAKPHQMITLKTVDQLLEADLRIAGIRSEFSHYDADIRIKYASAFLLLDNEKDLIAKRNSYNTSMVYTVSSAKWTMYASQQDYFKRPLFRYSTDLCLQKFNPFGLVLPENSIYLHLLRLHVMRIQETGLLMHWNKRAMYEMVKAGRIRLQDLSIAWNSQPIDWQEWRYVMALYMVGLGLGFFAFVLELAMHCVGVVLDQL